MVKKAIVVFPVFCVYSVGVLHKSCEIHLDSAKNRKTFGFVLDCALEKPCAISVVLF